MKEVIYRNRTSGKKQRRAISVSEKSQSKDYSTHIQKHFVYVAKKQNGEIESLLAPEYHIIKSYDTKTKCEKFYFRVKGTFYMMKEKGSYKIHFCHSLKIDLVPKKKRKGHKNQSKV